MMAPRALRVGCGLSSHFSSALGPVNLHGVGGCPWVALSHAKPWSGWIIIVMDGAHSVESNTMQQAPPDTVSLLGSNRGDLLNSSQTQMTRTHSLRTGSAEDSRVRRPKPSRVANVTELTICGRLEGWQPAALSLQRKLLHLRL